MTPRSHDKREIERGAGQPVQQFGANLTQQMIRIMRMRRKTSTPMTIPAMAPPLRPSFWGDSVGITGGSV